MYVVNSELLSTTNVVVIFNDRCREKNTCDGNHNYNNSFMTQNKFVYIYVGFCYTK